MITPKGISKLITGESDISLGVQDFTKVGNQKVAAKFKLKDDTETITAVMSKGGWQKMCMANDTESPIKNGTIVKLSKDDVSIITPNHFSFHSVITMATKSSSSPSHSRSHLLLPNYWLNSKCQ